MQGSGQDSQVIQLAIVLAIAAIVFRRALLRLALAIVAVVALVLLSSGAVVLFKDFFH
ncbi:MAG TPA: hypothetical protein VF834_00420 [Streptosporangiaceae bacterium]